MSEIDREPQLVAGRTLQKDLAIDALCEKFEAALKAGESPSIADYLAGASESLRGPLELELQNVLSAFRESNLEKTAVTAEGDTCVDRGTQIGPYKLVSKLGEGGMGEVWVVEQEQPIRREAALKFIKAGMDSKSVLGRFEQERQALALLDHPNIARVLDGGLTPERRPYFVMELVKGPPLTIYCDENRLDINERLALFVTICQAVQHAHQKGIVHRDLKPSNILVTRVDGKPVVKVIDFGVAKVIGGGLTNDTLATEWGAVVGTLEYMAPEQAGATSVDIDTRADIYSLGVILYELLTGLRPFDSHQLRKVPFDEVVRIVREDEPPRPSTRLSTDASQTNLAEARRMEPKPLAALLRGDLDWIVMKCLEKERSRRYESASSLGREIERYLASEPVEARPPSTFYQLKKFVRRHRGAVSAATAISGLLVAGTILSTWLAIKAQSAEWAARNSAIAAQAEEKKAKSSEAEARSTLTFFENKVLAAARPEDQEGGLGIHATIRDAVDAAEPQIAGTFQDQPLAEASVRNTLGTTYIYLSEPALAVPQLEAAWKIRQRELGEKHADTLMTQSSLAIAYRLSGEVKEAISLFERTLAAMRAELGADAPTTLTCQSDLADAYIDAGRYDDAIDNFQQVLEGRTAALGANHPRTLGSLNNLAQAHQTAGKGEAALGWFEQAHARMKENLGPDHPDTLTAQNNLAMALKAGGKLAAALPLLEDTRAKREEKLGPTHASTLTSLNNLAIAYQEDNRRADALPLLEQAWERRQEKLGPLHSDTLISLNNLALAVQAEGDLEKALPLLEQARIAWEVKFGPDHPHALTSKSNLAIAYQTVGKKDLALELYEYVERRRRELNGVDHAETTTARIDLVTAYREAERWADAEPLFLALFENAREKQGFDDRFAQVFLKHLLTCYEKLQQPDRAEPLLREIAAHSKTKDGAQSLAYGRQLVNLGLNLSEQGKYAEAETVLRECLAVREKNTPDEWTVPNSKSLVGASLLGQKKYAEAEPFLLEGYEGLKARQSKIPEAQRKLRLAQALDRLIGLYSALERPAEVEKWKAEAAALASKAEVPAKSP